MTLKETFARYEERGLSLNGIYSAPFCVFQCKARDALAAHKMQVVQSWLVEPSCFEVTKHSGGLDPYYLMTDGTFNDADVRYYAAKFPTLDAANLAALDAIQRMGKR
jgi:hypothetical protein